MASQADRIREHVASRLAALATTCGPLLAIQAGDVARSMGLVGRTPNICTVLKGPKFQRMAGLELVERRGPEQSTTTTYLYKQLPERPRLVPSVPVDANDGGKPLAKPGPAHKHTVRAPANESVAWRTADLCLVSCVAGKLSRSAPAKDLYGSDWFRKARGFVEARGWPWFILSAKYGLVAPAQVIAPYEKTLNNMPVAERRDWAEGCFDTLEPHLTGVKSVVFLAGKKYREFLAPALLARGIEVRVPMARLRQGEQLAWLEEHTP